MNNGSFKETNICRKEKQKGEIPAPRFGHTATYLGNSKVAIFGGAIGDAGKYNITDDIYIYDLSQNKWKKIVTENTPSARAAHAAACVDEQQLVIYGGATGGGSLSQDDLYILDLRKEQRYSWMTVPTKGVTPGRRYGHVMVFNKPNLIVIGGNNGQHTLNDVWFMHVELPPFEWVQVIISNNCKAPPPRVYHSADMCKEGPATGMIVIFGGRSAENKSLDDTWGLRQHRDGRWDWVEAPIKKGVPPEARYQHTAVFIGSKMFILGGRNDNGCAIPLSTALYNTETIEWVTLPAISKFRHTSWMHKHTIYTFGGFTHQTQQFPTNELECLDCCILVNATTGLDSEKRKTLKQSSLKQKQLSNENVKHLGGEVRSGSSSFKLNSQDVINPQQSSALASSQYAGTKQIYEMKNSAMAGNAVANVHNAQDVHNAQNVQQRNMLDSPSSSLFRLSSRPMSNKIRLAAHAHAVQETGSDFALLVRKISIDKLEEEGRKINNGVLCTPVNYISEFKNTVYDKIITTLLNPNITQFEIQYHHNAETIFTIPWGNISILCSIVMDIFKQEDMVLKLRAPLKIYGDIHGQYYDLMRLFQLYKCPVEEDLGEKLNAIGDIDSNDYLFLGDYVDRGSNSLEVICLLFALKCKYPKQIHLIRGNHEDMAINSLYGFQEECKRRLKEDINDKSSCWVQINQVFEWLPIGAIVEDKILCVHGGIGKSINTISDISQLRRPLVVSQVPQNLNEQKVTDLLWSDPTDNDSILGTIPNDIRDPDGTGHIVKYGPDRVHKFLEENDLQLIIRAHECVMDGFERFAGGKLITLFSATNYCNSHKNAGALLFIRRDLTVIPKLIYPAKDEVRFFNTWDTKMTELRPPTPPRNQPKMRELNFGAP
ncbi:protein phosphatase containing kelch-like domains, putative [Plasmodium knowlesi strain H]|uniref:Serine/threonine-protein phosphatase n=3 Tax=Plasmodium knowlesi TaxID=5850 RepID=A0A5K1UEZ1_PLAKH|nr:protein phosphatase containing kelch-like domains, putative [Plasmodium knowlesi strain H]OTN65607.1 Serine/threonine-protein phosphatase [Plasmodium knowlesi]CAA9989480.1 protein phosphatase containing kelch-like domains, putative [Plasmodium knowlesi strain H]SBO25143.1 protein phosphatase containing kelch-like domains, putative [Plasmodium knowlesi strain H]SBO27792.1 protein phosphatase containing kelch-like domains, putative [Plasmodium knowlesi strain H]VVS78954.1 protein phosphatase |eukprot:XP_002260205.1 protein serine/threonine phosphatase, putative [Plasmodium knowlesi strain H]